MTRTLFLTLAVLLAGCANGTAPSKPHDPYMGTVNEWTGLTKYPDTAGVWIIAHYLRPDSTQVDSLVTPSHVGYTYKCAGETSGSSGFPDSTLLRIDVLITGQSRVLKVDSLQHLVVPADTVALYRGVTFDPLASPNPSWGTSPDNFLIWRMAISDTTSTAPATVAVVAEPQDNPAWYNTCNR